MGNEADTNLMGGYTNERGDVVEQQFMVVSGQETLVTKVTGEDGSVDIYVDKALSSQMKDYAEDD